MTTSTVDEALALEATDWAAAVELLESTNRARPSDDVQIALAAMRHRAYPGLATRDGSPPAPPSSSPPIGPSGLPEATLTGLTAGHVRAAVLEHGCLLVRGAVGPDEAAALREGIDGSFAAQEHDAPDPKTAWWWPLPLDGPQAASLGRRWVRGGGGVLLADSPRLMAQVLDLYRDLGLWQLVADYLGTRPVFSANKCTLRRSPVTNNGDWHQDGAFLGTDDIRAVNLWLTLTPCGLHAPGLDLVPRRLDAVVETGTGGAYFDWAVGPQVVERVAGEHGVVRPIFEAGDLLVFDELFLHRTAVDPETMTEPRHAIEFWSFAADAYPGGQVPIVW